MDKTKVVVLDMQPIDPPVGGGRIRLLGLYSGFKNNVAARYVGTYDWRGPGFREHKLSECLTEINVPLSEEHFIAHDKLSAELGKGCIDTAFPMLGHLSKDYISRAKEEAKEAQIVIFSHPWIFPFVVDILDNSKQLIVYDSHNCEGLLRVKLIDDGSEIADKISREAVRCEAELCKVADLILACSEEDKQSYINIYGIEPEKIIIVPNGVFTERIVPCEDRKKIENLRNKYGLTKPAACFIGSGYYPNEEAARLIVEVADMLPQYQFIIIGGVGNSLKDIDINKHSNVIITGFVDEQEKLEYLYASDIAINPMLSGSGTNIKMFDFMAAGLPIVTTDVGARGIKNTADSVYLMCEKNKYDLKDKIEILFDDKNLCNRLKEQGRKEACEKFSWERISLELGYKLVQNYKSRILKEEPFYSIIIPSYERHDLLKNLLNNISKQTFKDFEIIIIDQSKEIFTDFYKYDNGNVLYYKTDIKGAVKARNTGIRLARGKNVAFIDDDCIPDENWLKNAALYLEQDHVVGVEGLIRADIYDDKKYRVVNNINFEGIGFMTANLFIKLDILKKINGFDESFDNPHFREDTDLGWRALEYGEIPYAKDVIVLHPSHPRDKVRESIDERNKFFIHDPLLLKKHPEKFVSLFTMESHYKNETYWRYFAEGMKRHSVSIEILKKMLNDSKVEKKNIPNNIIKLISSSATDGL